MPTDTKQIVQQTSTLQRVLKSRLDSLSVSMIRFKTKGESEAETLNIYQQDMPDNTTLLEQSKEVISALLDRISAVRDEERDAQASALAKQR